jgi:hypothetical protein
MKTCSKCRKSFDPQQAKCPHCGTAVTGSSGLFQTSSVLISSGGADLVYRSVDEVPVALRNKLLKSTNGQNSATILIADRRGRQEVAKAVRALPGSAQKRLVHSLLGNQTANARAWLLAARRRAIFAVLLLLTAAVIVFLFVHHWQ